MQRWLTNHVVEIGSTRYSNFYNKIKIKSILFSYRNVTATLKNSAQPDMVHEEHNYNVQPVKNIWNCDAFWSNLAH